MNDSLILIICHDNFICATVAHPHTQKVDNIAEGLLFSNFINNISLLQVALSPPSALLSSGAGDEHRRSLSPAVVSGCGELRVGRVMRLAV